MLTPPPAASCFSRSAIFACRASTRFARSGTSPEKYLAMNCTPSHLSAREVYTWQACYCPSENYAARCARTVRCAARLIRTDGDLKTQPCVLHAAWWHRVEIHRGRVRRALEEDRLKHGLHHLLHLQHGQRERRPRKSRHPEAPSPANPHTWDAGGTVTAASATQVQWPRARGLFDRARLRRTGAAH